VRNTVINVPKRFLLKNWHLAVSSLRLYPAARIPKFILSCRLPMSRYMLLCMNSLFRRSNTNSDVSCSWVLLTWHMLKMEKQYKFFLAKQKVTLLIQNWKHDYQKKGK